MTVPIERQIILADGEDFSALHLAAVLHQLREYGQVGIRMQGGKVHGISQIANDVLGHKGSSEVIDKMWQDSLV